VIVPPEAAAIRIASFSARRALGLPSSPTKIRLYMSVPPIAPTRILHASTGRPAPDLTDPITKNAQSEHNFALKTHRLCRARLSPGQRASPECPGGGQQNGQPMTARGTPTRGAREPARFRTMLRQPLAAGTAALVIGAALSLGVALLVRDEWQDAVHARFERRTARVTAMLRHELLAGVGILDSARGALALVPQMTPEQWTRYAQSLDLDASRSPVRQLGYAPLSEATRAALAGHAPMPARPLATATLSAPPSVAPVVRFGAPDAQALARTLRTGEVALGVHPADDDLSYDARTLTLFVPVAATASCSPR